MSITFHLNNYRCFSSPTPAQITPLTIMVGENSTGKSSFLAAYRMMLSFLGGEGRPNFNDNPFFLGAYDQIAHYRGGMAGRSNSFGFAVETQIVRAPSNNSEKPKFVPMIFSFEFEKRGSQPELRSFESRMPNHRLHLTYSSKNTPRVIIKLPHSQRTLRFGEIPFIGRGMNLSELNFHHLVYFLMDFTYLIEAKAGKKSKMKKLERKEAGNFSEAYSAAIKEIVLDPFASAPVRTKPERTYNPIEVSPQSEGAHVPLMLAKTRFSDKRQWSRLKSALDAFGRASGLYKEINLKTLGHTDSDPFQIMLKIAGPSTNLIDVGYGVSQVLPLVVDLISSKSPHHYLLQQPEIHLHPQAQAELGSFMAHYVATSESRLMVETHSDFIIDRIRMEVRDNKTLPPKDVSILFFERQGLDVEIHSIELDQNGNLIGAPPSFRDFFMKEELKLLGASDVPNN